MQRYPFSEHYWDDLVAVGFFGIELVADDYEFLQTVRVRGLANASLTTDSAVVIDELEFWHLPYSIRPAARRAEPTEHQRSIAAAELERERREWAKAQETREQRGSFELPRWRQFGKVVERHYVPQWKLDESGETAEAQARAEERRRGREAQRRREVGITSAHERRLSQAAEAAALARAQAERSLKQLDRLEDQVREMAFRFQDANALKQKILTLLRNTAPMLRHNPLIWKREELMRSTGCIEPQFMEACLQELVRDGKLRKVSEKERAA